MKSLFMIVALLGATGLRTVVADEAPSPNTLVLCGLDYSMVKMIGTMDFREPDKIFPDMLTTWNGMFVTESLPQIETLGAPLRTDTTAVEAPNQKASASQVIREDGTRSEEVEATHITDAKIADAVRSYKLKEDQGLGLVFVIDRLVKAQQTGCLYVVFFDVASRKVVLSQRLCEPARGFGFRNYWFGPIKDAVKKLPGLYKEAKAKR